MILSFFLIFEIINLNMQSLKQDLERAMGTSKRSYSSILEAIGVDIDTKEMSEPMNVVFSSAVNEVSQAG
jgi:hypothetical protein